MLKVQPSDDVRVFFTNRAESAALIPHQKPRGAVTTVHFTHHGISFERTYPDLVLFPTFYHEWLVAERGQRSVAVKLTTLPYR